MWATVLGGLQPAPLLAAVLSGAELSKIQYGHRGSRSFVLLGAGAFPVRWLSCHLPSRDDLFGRENLIQLSFQRQKKFQSHSGPRLRSIPLTSQVHICWVFPTQPESFRPSPRNPSRPDGHLPWVIFTQSGSSRPSRSLGPGSSEIESGSGSIFYSTSLSDATGDPLMSPGSISLGTSDPTYQRSALSPPARGPT